jgi:aldose 1-epimerase
MAQAEQITLTDTRTGATAGLAPELGFNCFSFRGLAQGAPVELLWREDGFELGGKRASGSGIPLLFPFPGRIGGTTFVWQGRQFALAAGDGRGNAIHGFVHERSWRVLEQTTSLAQGQFHAAADAPELLDCWPADFRITATYEIGPNQLRSTFLLENPGDTPLPCGFGIHPYFRLPWNGTDAASYRVQLPVSTNWELQEMLTTGQQQPLDDAADYQRGQAFGDLELDNVFGGLRFDQQHLCHAALEDPITHQRLTMSFDNAFRECVVYTPPHRQAICIEPLTCVPDPFRLNRAGIDAGLRIVDPGESFSAEITLTWTPHAT